MLEVRILPGEPKLFGLNLRLSTECLACEVRIGSPEVLERKAVLGKAFRVKKRRHENVIVLSDFGATESSLEVAPQADSITSSGLKFLGEKTVTESVDGRYSTPQAARRHPEQHDRSARP